MKPILWIGFFGLACLVGLVSPIWGVVGYMSHYCLGPDRQWWGVPLKSLGLRYSFTLATCTAIGITLNWGQIRKGLGKNLLHSQEKLLLLFLLVAWLGTILSPPTTDVYYTSLTHPSIKLTKIIIFCFMLTHVVTNLRNLNRVIWTIVIAGLILGMQAYQTPTSQFTHGRLNSIGGVDFGEGNFLAAFLSVTFIITGFQFYRSGLFGKAMCCLSGVFAANAIILTRSRGGFLGLLVAGCIAIALVPREQRVKIILGLAIAAAATVYLMDPQFMERFATIAASRDERDASAESRLELWDAGGRMWWEHPLGVGFGNWYQNVAHYIPKYAGKDSHSTYVKIGAELGIQGIAFFLSLIANAFVILRRVRRRAVRLAEELSKQFTLLSMAFGLALIAMLTCAATMTFVATEALWWVLVLPVCLERCLNNVEVRCSYDTDLDLR